MPSACLPSLLCTQDVNMQSVMDQLDVPSLAWSLHWLLEVLKGRVSEEFVLEVAVQVLVVFWYWVLGVVGWVHVCHRG